MDLLQRVTPKTVKDVVGNKIMIKNLIDTLKDRQHSPKVLLLLGPTGCGKTTLCNLLFKELNFKVYEVGTKDTLAHANTYMLYRTIDSYVDTKRPILFLDNIDILINTERAALSMVDDCITNLIRTNTYLLMTSKYSEEKTITNALKKNVEVFRMGYPPIKDAFIYLSSVLPDEPEEELLQIVKKQRGNIRDVVLNIKSSQKELDDIVKRRGYNEYNNFEIIQAFLLNNTWNDVLSILNNDPSMISYLLYENVIDDIYHNREANSTMSSYWRINSCYVSGSILEKHTHSHLDWSLYNLIQLIKVGGIYCILKNLKTKKERKDVKFRFSQVLSKLSHRNMMQKKFNSFTLPSIDMIHLIDAKLVEPTDDVKQISTTYHKYFA